MKHYIIELLSPGNSNTKYKIWVAISVIIQATCTLLPAMLLRDASTLQEWFLYVSLGVAIGSMLLTVTNWQKWIAYGLAFYGLTICLLLVVLDLTNSAMMIYLLAWSMSVSLGYGRELYNLKWFFAFMSAVLVYFAIGLIFESITPYTSLERIISVLSGTFVIAMNIYLWSKEAKMSSNHYSERRQKYEDIASLSEKMTSILSTAQDPIQAFRNIVHESAPGLHLDYCMIFLEKDGMLASIDGVEQLSIDKSTLVGATFQGDETNVITDNAYSNYQLLKSFVHAKSEIATPIYNDKNRVGIIYGASLEKDILRERHMQAFQVIASFCGLKLAQIDAEQSIRDAERKQAEVDQYKELDELKNRFIANISHDLKTPLSLIKGPAKQIAQISTDEKVKALSSYVINNADHLLRVVHQLLQLNRIEKGINELYFQKVELSNLCKKINGQYEERAQSKSIQLSMHSPDISIVTDAFRLEQIIHNLLSNALRYTQPGGEIAFSAHVEGDVLICSMKDTGVGIPQELQEKVFDRFYKIDENNQEGTGIGLSLVQEYVQLLEGTISLSSEVGKGTTFTVHLPLVHSASGGVEQQENAHIIEITEEKTGKPHMLVVEDHADLNQFICSYFENNFVMQSAFDGDEALEKIDRLMPDIIITDLMMPKRDGKSLVEAIRGNDEWAHIPIIVLSAKSQATSKIELYELGVDNFLAKPFDIEELEAVVNATLKQRKQLRDIFRSKHLNTETIAEKEHVQVIQTEQTEELVIEASTLLEDLKAYISDHIDESELSVNEIAKQMGMGRNRFQKEVKELSGLTPVEFVRSYRLNEARLMLKDKSRNVSEVAYAVGFSNLSYFTRSFKQEFGILPSEV